MKPCSKVSEQLWSVEPNKKRAWGTRGFSVAATEILRTGDQYSYERRFQQIIGNSPVPALQVDPDAPFPRPGEGGGRQDRVGCEGSAGLAFRIRGHRWRRGPAMDRPGRVCLPERRLLVLFERSPDTERRSEERRVGEECRGRW